MAEATKVLYQLEGDGTTIRYSDQGLSNVPGPPQLAYHGPLAEDGTFTEGASLLRFVTVAGTLVYTPPLTVLLPEIPLAEIPEPSPSEEAGAPVDFQTVAIISQSNPAQQVAHFAALNLKGTAHIVRQHQ